MRNIVFNSLALQDANIISSDAPHEDSGLMVDVEVIGEDGGAKTGQRFGLKVIKISATVKDTTEAALDARIDALKASIISVEGNLDIDYSGETRRYRAIGGGFRVLDRRGRVTAVSVEIDFVAIRLGESTTPIIDSLTGQTANISNSFTMLGSYAPQPTITVTINSCTAMSDLTIANTDTGTSIVVTRAFVAGDVVIIDTKNKTVKVNGVETDYTGIIPRWILGLNHFTASVTATAFNMDFVLSYVKRFL